MSYTHACSGRSLLDPTHSEEVLAVGNISFCFHDNSIIHLTHTGTCINNLKSRHINSHAYRAHAAGEGVSSDVILSLSKAAQNQAKYLLKLVNEAVHST